MLGLPRRLPSTEPVRKFRAIRSLSTAQYQRRVRTATATSPPATGESDRYREGAGPAGVEAAGWVADQPADLLVVDESPPERRDGDTLKDLVTSFHADRSLEPRSSRERAAERPKTTSSLPMSPWPELSSPVSRSSLLVSEMYLQHRSELLANQIASIRSLEGSRWADKEERSGLPSIGFRAMAESDRIADRRFHVLLDP
eukprot:745874-Hanusia_phi.AAC.1